jgi:hypothetical protein
MRSKKGDQFQRDRLNLRCKSAGLLRFSTRGIAVWRRIARDRHRVGAGLRGQSKWPRPAWPAQPPATRSRTGWPPGTATTRPTQATRPSPRHGSLAPVTASRSRARSPRGRLRAGRPIRSVALHPSPWRLDFIRLPRLAHRAPPRASITWVSSARSNPDWTSMRAAPTTITIVALDPRTRVRRTRTIRTCGAPADRVAGPSAVAAAAGCCPPIWRSRYAQYVSVDGLKSRPCANAVAVCPLDFHSFTLSDHFFSVVQVARFRGARMRRAGRRSVPARARRPLGRPPRAREPPRVDGEAVKQGKAPATRRVHPQQVHAGPLSSGKGPSRRVKGPWTLQRGPWSRRKGPCSGDKGPLRLQQGPW